MWISKWPNTRVIHHVYDWQSTSPPNKLSSKSAGDSTLKSISQETWKSWYAITEVNITAHSTTKQVLQRPPVAQKSKQSLCYFNIDFTQSCSLTLKRTRSLQRTKSPNSFLLFCDLLPPSASWLYDSWCIQLPFLDLFEHLIYMQPSHSISNISSSRPSAQVQTSKPQYPVLLIGFSILCIIEESHQCRPSL